MAFEFNQKVKDLSSVPNDFQGLYEAAGDGDGFVLRADDATKSAVSAITGLNKALKVARAEAAGFKGSAVDLSALADYGKDPSEILTSFNEKLAAAIKDQPTKEDMARQLDKIKADLSKAHSEELKVSSKRGDALKSQLYGHLVTSAAKTALAEAGAIDSDLALPFLERQVKVIEEDGTFSVNVVDGTGDARYSGVTGSPMSVGELVAEMKANEKYGPLFKSEVGAGGSGTPAEGGRRSNANAGDKADKSPTEKIRSGLEARQKK
jgi:hypothetical protein